MSIPMQHVANDQRWQRPAHRTEGLPAAYTRRLLHLKEHAAQLTGAFVQLQNMIEEVLGQGGTLQAQDKLNYITGAVLRLQKDVGVIEFLQAQGVRHKPPARNDT